ncbi:ureidoglycolate hydrolase [Aspergillus chevalieri]|uniref:Ureidoglycolate hydrolase n=1 Tax=Aspergillus chevalieri TaxID=182096 RepID=A0A7R7ZQJ3_ASPCH|nr:uncharacterized protein ACHE_60640S [Aspergillus chevalieri]BCR90753.1 hypothetical protein ACHE_60640S [Aspergillus chevalieri]
MATSILTPAPSPLRLSPKPLTPDSFAPFGSAIISPLPHDLVSPPSLSSLQQQHGTPTPVLANQSTAIKYSPVSPLQNEYSGSPSGQPSSARMSMFCCFPRELRHTSNAALFDVRILERHPYTTQTFTPLNSVGEDQHIANEPLYLVIVAPTLKGQTAAAIVKNPTTRIAESVTITDPPDLSKVKAFVARRGQAVTYGAGTWHAPMVVLGKRRVDFVVVQFANGVAEEDCQEVAFEEGIEVEVDSNEGNRLEKL